MSAMRKTAWILALAVSVACQGTEPGNESTNRIEILASGVSGAKLLVPKGVDATALSISQAASRFHDPGFRAVGKGFTCGPDGATFPTPVTVRLPVSEEALQGYLAKPEDLSIFTRGRGEGRFHRLPTRVVDGGHAVEADLSHFSDVQVGLGVPELCFVSDEKADCTTHVCALDDLIGELMPADSAATTAAMALASTACDQTSDINYRDSLATLGQLLNALVDDLSAGTISANVYNTLVAAIHDAETSLLQVPTIDATGTWLAYVPLDGKFVRLTLQLFQRSDATIMGYVLGGTDAWRIASGTVTADHLTLSIELTTSRSSRTIVVEGAVSVGPDAPSTYLAGVATLPPTDNEPVKDSNPQPEQATPVVWHKTDDVISERTFVFMGSNDDQWFSVAVAVSGESGLVSGTLYMPDSCDGSYCHVGGVFDMTEAEDGHIRLLADGLDGTALSIDAAFSASDTSPASYANLYTGKIEFIGGASTFKTALVQGYRGMRTDTIDANAVLETFAELAYNLVNPDKLLDYGPLNMYPAIDSNYRHDGEWAPALLAGLQFQVNMFAPSKVEFTRFRNLATMPDPRGANPFDAETGAPGYGVDYDDRRVGTVDGSAGVEYLALQSDPPYDGLRHLTVVDTLNGRTAKFTGNRGTAPGAIELPFTDSDLARLTGFIPYGVRYYSESHATGGFRFYADPSVQSLPDVVAPATMKVIFAGSFDPFNPGCQPQSTTELIGKAGPFTLELELSDCDPSDVGSIVHLGDTLGELAYWYNGVRATQFAMGSTVMRRFCPLPKLSTKAQQKILELRNTFPYASELVDPFICNPHEGRNALVGSRTWTREGPSLYGSPNEVTFAWTLDPGAQFPGARIPYRLSYPGALGGTVQRDIACIPPSSGEEHWICTIAGNGQEISMRVTASLHAASLELDLSGPNLDHQDMYEAAPPKANCDDHNVCTDDRVSPTTGECEHFPNASPCDDGDACTYPDMCVYGSCLGFTVDCNDGNPCTDDSCDPTGGCRHDPVIHPCDDGNACTTLDYCAEGTCNGGIPVECDDDNECTDDSCDPATGCVHSPNHESSTTYDPPTFNVCVNTVRVGHLLNCETGLANTCGCYQDVYLPDMIPLMNPECFEALVVDSDRWATCVDYCIRSHDGECGPGCSDQCAVNCKLYLAFDLSGGCVASGCVARNAQQALCQLERHPGDPPCPGQCEFYAMANTCCATDAQCGHLDACHPGTCQEGRCTYEHKACPPTDACHGPGVCDPVCGACTDPPKVGDSTCNNGTLVWDQDASYRTDRVAFANVTIPVPPTPVDFDSQEIWIQCEKGTFLVASKPLNAPGSLVDAPLNRIAGHEFYAEIPLMTTGFDIVYRITGLGSNGDRVAYDLVISPSAIESLDFIGATQPGEAPTDAGTDLPELLTAQSAFLIEAGLQVETWNEMSPQDRSSAYSALKRSYYTEVLGGPPQGPNSLDGWTFSIPDSPGTVYQRFVDLVHPGTYVFRTHGLQPGMDTVLHVWDLATDQWLASNDDIGAGDCTFAYASTDALGSCVQIHVDAHTPVAVFVHRYDNMVPVVQPCLLEVGEEGQNPLVLEYIYAAGDVARTFGYQSTETAVTWDRGDVFQFAFLVEGLAEAGKSGLLSPVVLLLNDTEHLDNYDGNYSACEGRRGLGIWGQPNVRARSPAGAVGPAVVVGRFYWSDCVWDPLSCGDGTGYLFRNDSRQGDSDGDEVGDGLEGRLGTDPLKADTDGDGLRDDWEVFGGCTFFGCDPSSSDGISFAMYGASPNAKDLFAQIDMMATSEFAVPIAPSTLFDGLTRIQETFASPASATGVAKNPIHVFFDWGQLFGRGGVSPRWHLIPYQPVFCNSANASLDCLDLTGTSCYPPTDLCTWPSDCAEGEECPPCFAEGKICSSFGHCVSTACGFPCVASQEIHAPYNLEEVVRGGIGANYLLSRNRRGTFVEIMLSSTLQFGDCQGEVGYCIDSPGAMYPLASIVPEPKWFVPPAIVIGVNPKTSLDHFAVSLFHEMGHTFGLTHRGLPSDVHPIGTSPFHIPNHVSNMSYTFYSFVDAAGHLDYSSGNRPALSPWISNGSPCNVDDDCTNTNEVCRESMCVVPGLDEKIGIGNLFASGGNNYFTNKAYQLGFLVCMSNSAVVDGVAYNGGVGPAPIWAFEQTYPANIDWNKNGELEIGSLVTADFFEPMICPDFATVTRVETYEDPDEWGRVSGDDGFQKYGLRAYSNPEPVKRFGTLICSADEQIACPVLNPPRECLAGVCY